MNVGVVRQPSLLAGFSFAGLVIALCVSAARIGLGAHDPVSFVPLLSTFAILYGLTRFMKVYDLPSLINAWVVHRRALLIAGFPITVCGGVLFALMLRNEQDLFVEPARTYLAFFAGTAAGGFGCLMFGLIGVTCSIVDADLGHLRRTVGDTSATHRSDSATRSSSI